MRIALLSDIHGNARALKAVLHDLQKQKIDRMYILGDICYRGPEPKNALETVRSSPAKVLKGNADEWVVRGVLRNEVPDQALAIMNQERDWTLERLTADDLNYLENLPESFVEQFSDAATMHAFHATPSSLFDVVAKDQPDEQIADAFISADTNANIIVYGHIHTPFIKTIGNKTFINTGSVGLPFDGDPRPSYVLLHVTDDTFSASIERVSYDIDRVVKQYDANDYPNSEQMKATIKHAKKP
ncbi:phosphoesterase, MJ0936 family [Alteribacillus persepolensis]|uniref:Phosphoesterase, MJ0936 family n=1 Tax=Alteribacillus persepolensis TaxID=568899 RepID=A0A1G7ZB74_9BACI|nr:metallophosphoesterase family protein [Alteribacillus persepolensis]SDH05879.1 phosphoesterase, MJ0936 family [Alteribacillus persepolensis]